MKIATTRFPCRCLIVIAAFVLVGCRPTAVPVTNQVSPTSAESIETARNFLLTGNEPQAVEVSQQVLISDPDNSDALRILSRALAAQSRYAEAAEVGWRLAQVEPSDPVLEYLLVFDWCLRASDDGGAERALRQAIAQHPNDVRPHRTLAQLLNAQGRRVESAVEVLAIEQCDAMNYSETLSLIDLGGPFQLTEFGELIARPQPSLYDLGKGRRIFDRGVRVAETLNEVDKLVHAFPQSAAVRAFQGRVLAQQQDVPKLTAWLDDLPPDILTQPEYWFAVGTWLTLQKRDHEAVRAFIECLRLDPTEHRALASLAESLIRIGEPSHAAQAQRTRGKLEAILRLANHADGEQSLWIAGQLQELLRPWEAIAWYRHALELQGQVELRRQELEQRREQVRQWQASGTVDRIRDVRLKTMIGFDRETFPWPDLKSAGEVVAMDVATWSAPPIRFSEVAGLLGIKTTFDSGYPADGLRFFLHQANGGGIAALDYDLDGACDLYFAQSGGDPRKPNDSSPNQLYRNLAGERFVDVSVASQTADRRFGQGVSAADINQDGFLDLLIANIGMNSLYLNQGDGTFRARHELIQDNIDRWTSSLAAADLDGDSLPDLVEVNYIDDPAIYTSPCHGKNYDCTPQRFRAASDRILRNDGSGALRVEDSIANGKLPPSYGLGVVIANFDSIAGNDVFISNDGDLNHFWKSQTVSTDLTPGYQLVECASLSGCSVGRAGYSQACMGIACGDFDHNGKLDLIVSNFFDEPVNLYLQNAAGLFIDEASQYGLVEPSMKMLGFGTQAADFDNDGWLDVAVLNGHLYDARNQGVPYRMTGQLFHGHRGQFTLQAGEETGAYWQREQLGRTLVKCDFNRDGRVDLVANHLDQPIEVLKNECPAANWVDIELIGTTNERSAVGSRVTVVAADQQWTAWRTSGDGYMGSNESVLHFGIGNHANVDRVEVIWPDGRQDTLPVVEINRRLLIIEGQDLLFYQ